MTLSISVAMRNAGLDAMVAAIGNAAVLKILTGSPPASLSTADTGTLLLTYPLAATWGTLPASGGVKNLANVPIAAATQVTGTAGHFRIYDGSGTAHMQGTVGLAGSGADMILDNTAIISGPAVNILAWTLTDGNSS